MIRYAPAGNVDGESAWVRYWLLADPLVAGSVCSVNARVCWYRLWSLSPTETDRVLPYL